MSSLGLASLFWSPPVLSPRLGAFRGSPFSAAGPQALPRRRLFHAPAAGRQTRFCETDIDFGLIKAPTKAARLAFENRGNRVVTIRKRSGPPVTAPQPSQTSRF